MTTESSPSARNCRSLRSPATDTRPFRPILARARPGKALKLEIRRVRNENVEADGAHRIWQQLNREGIPVVQCTVKRLTRE